jgi:hypothetical protein
VSQACRSLANGIGRVGPAAHRAPTSTSGWPT